VAEGVGAANQGTASHFGLSRGKAKHERHEKDRECQCGSVIRVFFVFSFFRVFVICLLVHYPLRLHNSRPPSCRSTAKPATSNSARRSAGVTRRTRGYSVSPFRISRSSQSGTLSSSRRYTIPVAGSRNSSAGSRRPS